MSDIPSIDFAEAPTVATARGGDIPPMTEGGGDVRRSPAPNARTSPKAPLAPGVGDRVAGAVGGTTFDAPIDVKEEFIQPLVSGADLVGSIPAMVAGTALGISSRATSLLTGGSRAEQSGIDLAMREKAQEVLGNPVRKLLSFAGLGESGEGDIVAGTMGKLSTMIEKGGDYIEHITGGAVTKEDTQAIADTAMSLGAGRGMKVGLAKLIKGSEISAVASSSGAEAAKANAANQAADVTDAARNISQKADTAATAAKAVAPRGDIPPVSDIPSMEPGPSDNVHFDSALNTALAKVGSGRAFDMTAEERIAYRGWQKAPPIEPPVADSGEPQTVSGQPLRFPRGQLGAVDVSAFMPGGAPGRGLNLTEFMGLSPELSLGSLIARSDYTLKTLDRLPQNRSSFPRTMVEEQLKRPDVTDAERAAITTALDGAGPGPISAKDLVVGVKKATGDFELRAREVTDYADYGLANIDRTESAEYFEDQDGSRVEPHPDGATTTLYRLPDGVKVDSSNHFADDQLFGWTRSFTEQGMRYVVEIQSDLAQKTKALSPDMAEKVQAYRDATGDAANQLRDYLKPGAKFTPEGFEAIWERFPSEVKDALENYFGENTAGNIFKDKIELAKEGGSESIAFTDLRRMAKSAFDSLDLWKTEATTKLNAGRVSERIAPILKNWPKRLIREEMARDAVVREERLAELRRGLESERAYANETDSSPKLRNYAAQNIEKYQREIAALEKGPKPVRFATAETVKKVEGWPEQDPVTRAEQIYDSARHAHSIADSSYHHYRDVMYRGLRDDGTAFDEENRVAQRGQIEQRKLAAERAKEKADAAFANLEAARASGIKPSLSPEHQSIYDRYKKDIEKFLKQQGGKEVEDSLGHTWIEVPPLPKRGPTQMFGGADPKVLARMAVIGVAGYAAYQMSTEDKALRAILGAAGAAMLSKARPVAFARAILSAIGKEGPRFSIADLAQGRADLVKLTAMDTILLQRKIEALLPKDADHARVLDAFRKGTVASLTGDDLKAAKILADAFDLSVWKNVPLDVLEAAVKTYLPAIIDLTGDSAARLRAFMDAHLKANNVPGFAPAMPTISELEAAGFRLRTENLSEMLGLYSNSVTNAIGNKGLITALKGAGVPTNSSVGPARPVFLVMSDAKAPADYVPVDHPQLLGVRVHPDIEGQLKVLFDTAPAGEWMKAATAISDVTKRMRVSFSLFHMKSLTEAAIRASSSPLRVAGTLVDLVRGESRYIQELEKGGLSPMVVDFTHDGLMVSLKGAGSEDAGGSFYRAMTATQKFLDSIIPGAGLPVKGFMGVNKAVDHMMWERLHPALKILLWEEKRSQMMANGVPKEQAGKIAATFANDVEGGLNYEKIALEARTKFGRQAAEQAFSPSGRRALQIAFFAPDWNLAAVRVVANAFHPEGSVGGLWNPKTLADLNRQLIVKSGLYYLVGFNALNLAFSGHNIWENKDWTKIDMDPKGERHLQIDKGMMEVPNMIRHPQQELLNKLGYVPSELANQVLGTEYLSPQTNPRTGDVSAGPPMRGGTGVSGRAGHAARQLLPFAIKENPTKGPLETALTASGLVQITGSTPETRALRKIEAESRRRALKGVN